MTQTGTANATVGHPNAQLSALLELQETVHRNFPGAWPLVATMASAVATLLLEDAKLPTALFFVGQPSGLKTTLLSFLKKPKWLFYESDKFSSRSFVSHYAGKSSKKLGEIDLLPKIRNKVLVTPELSPTFRGRHDDLVEHFSIITRVLDGQGLMTDSGVHGQRGYRGDYGFVWLGATTPLPRSTWDAMATLGSRMYFINVPEDEVTDKELDDVIRGATSYNAKVEECGSAMNGFMSVLFPSESAVRSMRWDRSLTPDDCTKALTELARLLAHLRGSVPVIGRTGGNRPEYGSPLIEKPHRALQVLLNLARGHAVINGRSYLTLVDVALLLPIAFDSCPDHRRKLMRDLLRVSRGGGALTADQAGKAVGVTKETARSYLREMELLNLVQSSIAGGEELFQLHDRWSWFTGSEFSKLWNAQQLSPLV